MQLKPHRKVSRWFGTRLFRGRNWYLSGLPMGFSWAPFIAQSTSEGIMTEILRRLESAEFRVCGLVYIDNGIVAISDTTDVEAALALVEEIIRAVCFEAGAIIKESSVLPWPPCRMDRPGARCSHINLPAEASIRPEGSQVGRLRLGTSGLSPTVIWPSVLHCVCLLAPPGAPCLCGRSSAAHE